MADLYTKGVLTVIAAGVVVIAGSGRARAPAMPYIESPCGKYAADPCYVSPADEGRLGHSPLRQRRLEGAGCG
jgi:hypothetical protein